MASEEMLLTLKRLSRTTPRLLTACITLQVVVPGRIVCQAGVSPHVVARPRLLKWALAQYDAPSLSLNPSTYHNLQTVSFSHDDLSTHSRTHSSHPL